MEDLIKRRQNHKFLGRYGEVEKENEDGEENGGWVDEGGGRISKDKIGGKKTSSFISYKDL